MIYPIPVNTFRLMMPLARLLARFFHRRVEVHGLGHVPTDGPILLAANHPNMMLDVLLLSSTQPRALNFLAKATLFQNPILKSLLKSFGVLPVYRKRDNPEDMSHNRLTFAACYERLETSGAIALFPEGVSHDRNQVLPLKTGCARIALEAESKHGFSLNVRVVPVGISFSKRDLFRSDALVLYGPPILASKYRERYQTDPNGTVRAFTSELGHRLQELTRHIPQDEDEDLIVSLGEFFGPEEEATSERLHMDRILIDATRFFKRREPFRYQRLRRRLNNYTRLLKTAGLSEHHFDRDYGVATVARYLIPRIAIATLGAPIALIGTITNFIPYRIPRWLSNRIAEDPVEVATVKFFVGLGSFPIYYLLLFALVAWKLGIASSLLIVLAGSLTGLLSLFYSEALAGFGTEVYAFVVQRLSPKRLAPMHAMRSSLLAELTQCRDVYLQAQESSDQ